MATCEKLSMTAELLQGLKEKSYNTCVSNLTKTHCVNLKKFNRERLPEGTWITSKRFLSNTNRVVPNALFDLFGEFSNQTGSIIRDNMVGWTFDNFRMLEGVCRVAMEQRHTSLRVWINEMANENKCGDEIALYILSRMYRKHAFVYTQMFWWTSILYTLPIQERELVDQCEIVLLFLKPGVFGELHKIRPPTATISSPQKTETSKLLLSPSVIPQNVKPVMNEQAVEKVLTTIAVITEGTLGLIDAPTERIIVEPKKYLLDGPSPTSTVIQKQDSQFGQSKPDALPNINIFLMQRCNIPLIRCDYDSALKAADTHRKKIEPPNVDSSSSSAQALPTPSDETAPLRTSGRTRTVINYKQFLEEFADAPPSPPKRKTED